MEGIFSLTWDVSSMLSASGSLPLCKHMLLCRDLVSGIASLKVRKGESLNDGSGGMGINNEYVLN